MPKTSDADRQLAAYGEVPVAISQQPLKEILKSAASQLILSAAQVRGELTQDTINDALSGSPLTIKRKLAAMKLSLRDVKVLEPPGVEDIVKNLVHPCFFSPSNSGRLRKRAKKGKEGEEPKLVVQQFRTIVQGKKKYREGTAIFDLWRFYQQYKSSRGVGRYTGIRFGCSDGPADLVVVGDEFFVVVEYERTESFPGKTKRIQFHNILTRLTQVKMTQHQRQEFAGQTFRQKTTEKKVEIPPFMGTETLQDILVTATKNVLNEYFTRNDASAERIGQIKDYNLPSLRRALVQSTLHQQNLELFRGRQTKLGDETLLTLRTVLPVRYKKLSRADFKLDELLRPEKGEADMLRTGITFSSEVQLRPYSPVYKQVGYMLCVQSNGLVIRPMKGRRMVYRVNATQKRHFHELMYTLLALK